MCHSGPRGIGSSTSGCVDRFDVETLFGKGIKGVDPAEACTYDESVQVVLLRHYCGTTTNSKK
jgi:hypothetical protein